MKFENTAVFNIEGALRGMRLPLKSGAKADSHYCLPNECQICQYNCSDFDGWEPYMIGKNDLKLAQTLSGADSPHNKFLRQIFISTDITASLTLWKQLDQYRIGVTTDSESTMHTLAKTPIDISMFEMGDYDENLVIFPKGNADILDMECSFTNDFTLRDYWFNTIINLERLRQLYNETQDKRYWQELVRALPESFLQKRHWTANYAVVRNIYMQRCKTPHKLNEWKAFKDFAESLPYAKEILLYEKET